MCGRFVISSNNPYGLQYKSSYNVTPSQFIPVKTKDSSKLMKWSYAPLWKKEMNLINCRSETMNIKPSFKNAKRCIIFNNGWYEWQRRGKEKIPFYHYCRSNNFAGLYNEIGCLIITRHASDNISHIHHRQPVLLEDNEISLYLEGKNIINSNANNDINFRVVSKNVNNPQNDDSSLINEVKFPPN